MVIVWVLLNYALSVLFFAMIGRFFIMAIRETNPSWRPKGIMLVLAEVALTLTDPPMKLLNRFIKPVRIGGLQLDLSWTVLILLISFAQSFIRSQIS
ncbi:MAG: hypothetical protein RLZZ400_10 [Actinomycetota bacterium]|jgi:YggT family protein